MPSSVVLSIKYFAERETLRVTFVSGMVYDYKNVPVEIYEEIITSRSKRYIS